MSRILALEPYYGGSHRAFLDGWLKNSRHEFELLTLKAHHFKWRMRHAAVSFSQRIHDSGLKLDAFDAVWCSSMVNVAELRGLCQAAPTSVPWIVYFHENQLAYPPQRDDPRDVHFAFTNWVSCQAADQVWFNSAFNRRTLLGGLTQLFKHMPDHRSSLDTGAIEAKSSVLSPGIEPIQGERAALSEGPMRLTWAARWEHDKGPQVLLEALRHLKQRQVPFTISVLGERFKSVPLAFTQIQREFGPELRQFGPLDTSSAYRTELLNTDVFISTALHEFFGLAVLEAASAGCQLLVPNALVYPELYGNADVFFDGSPEHLAARVEELSKVARPRRLSQRRLAIAYHWPTPAQALDRAVEEAITAASGQPR